MNGERTTGALQYPAYLLMWSVGLLFFTGSFYKADAALVSAQPVAFAPLASIPTLVPEREFRLELNDALGKSEVMAGTWQPGEALADTADSHPPAASRSDPVAKDPVAKDPVAKDAVAKNPVGKSPVGAVNRSAEEAGSTRATGTAMTLDRSAETAGTHAPATAAAMEKRSVSVRMPRVNEEVVALRREARKALNLGDSGAAFRLLMRNLRSAGNDKEYLALLAVAALEERLPREALLVYEKLIKLDRLDSRWWMGLAVCQERLGADATAIYEEVIRLTEKGSDMQRLALDRIASVSGVT